jgi:hypothetical protein
MARYLLKQSNHNSEEFMSSIEILELPEKSTSFINVIDEEADRVHGGLLPLAGLALNAGLGAAGGALGKGISNYMQGKPLMENMPAAMTSGAIGGALTGPVSHVMKAVKVASPLITASYKSVIPASSFINPIRNGAITGAANGYLEK